MKKLVYSTYLEKGFGYVSDLIRQDVSIPLHNHDFFEIEFFTEAKRAVQILNGKERSIQKGSVYIINPSDLHSFELGKGGYFERYNVRFKQNAVNENILASVINTHCRCVLTGDDFDTAQKLFEIVKRYYNEGSENANTVSQISSRIIESLILLIRNRSSAEFEDDPNRKSQIQRILLYLHKNFKNEITLEEVANYSSFSPHYVSQLFHTETTMTITQYVTNLRLEYAKNLLFSTEHSISEICVQCGFHSFAHFLRSFKSAYGTTPSKYRSSIRSDIKLP